MRQWHFLYGLFFIALQASAQTVPMRFDFGHGHLMPGYTRVSTDTKYSDETGYGFDKYSMELQSADGKRRTPCSLIISAAQSLFIFPSNFPKAIMM